MAIFNKTTQELSEITYISLKELVSNKARKLLWGAGYLLNGEDDLGKERLQDILDWNGFQDVMNSTEINLSERLDGNQTIAVLPVGDKIRLDMIDNMDGSFFRWAQNGTLLEARTSKLVEYGIYEFQIIQTWSPKHMKTIVKRQTPTGLLTINTADYNATVPEEMRILDTYNYSNLGYIPLFTFTNNGSVGGTDYGDGYMVRNLQTMMNQHTKILFKELENNRTRLIGSPNNNQIQYDANGKVDYTWMNSDLMLNMGKETNPDKPLMDILQGDPKLSEYWDSINGIINDYMIASGYSGEGDNETNRTSSGTLFTKTGDIETTGIKRRVRETQLKDFIKMIIETDITYGIGNVYENVEDYSISILENKVFDETTKLTNITTAQQMGYLTDDKAISILYSTDDQVQIDAIKEELKTQDSVAIKQTQETNTDIVENGMSEPQEVKIEEGI